MAAYYLQFATMAGFREVTPFSTVAHLLKLLVGAEVCLIPVSGNLCVATVLCSTQSALIS